MRWKQELRNSPSGRKKVKKKSRVRNRDRDEEQGKRKEKGGSEDTRWEC